MRRKDLGLELKRWMRWERAAEIADIGRQRDSGTAMPTATETNSRCGVRWIGVAGSFYSTAQRHFETRRWKKDLEYSIYSRRDSEKQQKARSRSHSESRTSQARGEQMMEKNLH